MFAVFEASAARGQTDTTVGQLFATGKVGGVHVYANIVTVDLEKGYDSDGLAEIVRDMYQYWKAGVEPPTFEDLQPEEAATGVDDAAAAGGDAALTEAAKKVPMHLLVRAREARERWNAK